MQQRIVLSGALAALASQAMAGVVASASASSSASASASIDFVDCDWDNVAQGSKISIKWSQGNGNKVTVKVQAEDDWSESICGK